MTPVERLQLQNQVRFILHAPGNLAYGNRVPGNLAPGSLSSGRILEMAFIFDYNLSKGTAAGLAAETAGILKATDELFRNVRLNAVRWRGDTDIRHEVSALPLMQTGRFFENYESRKEEKALEILAAQLKKYQARSRLLLLFTDGNYCVRDGQKAQENLQPFLQRRLLYVRTDGEKCTVTRQP